MGSVEPVSPKNKLCICDTVFVMSYFKCRFFYYSMEKLCNHYEKQLAVLSTLSI